jgi:hypothetical protein
MTLIELLPNRVGDTMRIGGKKLDSGPSTELIVFPRDGDNDLVFRATAMLDRTDFDRLCPTPKPGKMRIRGGQLIDNPDDPKFKLAMDQHNRAFMDYMFITSLSSPSPIEGEPDLPVEWEKVRTEDRSTWHKWEDELKDAGLSDMERKRIFNVVMNVNSLNDAKLDEARASFLQRQREASEKSSSPMDEQTDTQSGEHANEQESDSQTVQPVGTISTKK